MPQQYRVELFNRDYSYYGMGLIGGSPNIRFDYLTLEMTDIKTPAIHAEKGLFANIVDMYGTSVYQGMVNDIQTHNGESTITIAPLLSLLDISIPYDRTLLQNGPVEQFIATVILDTYSRNADTLQNIPGVQCSVISSTQTFLNIKSNVHELWDICSRSLTVYGVMVSAKLDISARSLVFTIGRIPSTATIEADLPNCVNKVITVGDSFGATNKATYINKEDETERISYYLHTDGTVSTKDTDRVSPVAFTTEYIEKDDFEEEARSRAMNALTPGQYNNLIELSYRSDDKLVEPKTLIVGQPAKIIASGTSYDSVLTGLEIDNDIITLIFGVVRVDLTKKIIIERRTAGASANEQTGPAMNDFLNAAFPVGYVYISKNPNLPSNIAALGTWVRLQGVSIFAASDTDADFNVGDTVRGAKEETLATTQMPGHVHSFTGAPMEPHNHTQNDHAHLQVEVASTTNGAAGSLSSIGINGDIIWSATMTNRSTQNTNSTIATNNPISAGTPSGTIGRAGEGEPHNNLPPYLARYIWERIA